jgi:dTDP-4-amino-4,6-dideoxygalactose transaminase
MPPRRAIGPDERAMIDQALDYYEKRGEDPGYQGHFEERYNHSFAEMMGGGWADAVATGTVALFVALKALDLPAGSEILLSPITDPGSVSAIILAGHIPRLVDAAPDSYAAGPRQFEERITPSTRAAMVVHSVGRAADIAAITALCHGRGIKVIEDCSQSHGAFHQGRRIGCFGDVAAFSTMYRKASVTGASGGVVYSRDLDLYRRALAHADRGKPRWIEGFDDRDPRGFLFPALNLHTDELSCAIGIASLARLDETRQRRLAFVGAVSETLAAHSAVCHPSGWSEEDSPFVYPIFVDASRLTCSKLDFAKAVRAEGIGLNPHYNYLVADWPWAVPYLSDRFAPEAARAARDASFCLYLNENYGASEVEDVLSAILKVEKHYLR